MVHREGRRGRALIVFIATILVFAVVPAVVTAATGDFEDVPTTNIFYNDIAWMADSGVTKGCSSTRFCPNDSVTRQQMAAFMHRLATNGSVDAGSLGGLSASEYAKKTDIQPAATGSRATGASSNDLDDADGTALAAGLVSPANGIVILGGNVDVTATAGEDSLACWLTVNGDSEPLGGTMMFVTVDDVAGPAEGICSTSGIAVVSPGNFTFELVVGRIGGTAALWHGTLWAQWIPFDGTGSVPTFGADTFGDTSPSEKLPPGK